MRREAVFDVESNIDVVNDMKDGEFRG